MNSFPIVNMAVRLYTIAYTVIDQIKKNIFRLLNKHKKRKQNE